MDIIYLLAGIALAVVGANLLVDGGVAVAKRFGVSMLVIGATVVAFGTSTPELAVNISSALDGNTDLALGNVLGSNLFNICMIIGVVAMIAPMPVSSDSRAKDLPMCLLGALMIGIAGNDLYFDHIDYHELALSDGLVFLLFFGVFMKYVWLEVSGGGQAHIDRAARRGAVEDGAEEPGDAAQLGTRKAVVWILLGLAGLVAGGEFIVEGATGVEEGFGLSERVIGLVIVGPGTSMPELVASIVAARKGQADMVIGNVLGSNIFNVFLTLGVTSLILPVPLDLSLNTAVLVNIGATAFLILVVRVLRTKPIGRVTGLLLITLYVAHIAASFAQ